jgi:hypothetical protein
MKCVKCSNEATIKYPNGDLCNDCFIAMLVSRIKKELRAEQSFQKNERVLVFGKITVMILAKVVEGLPLSITEATDEYDPANKYNEYDKVVIPWTADDEAQLFYEQLTKKNPTFEALGTSKRIVKLFKTITEKELLQAAKALDVSVEPKQKDKELAAIQKKYPGATIGLVKSAQEFKKALQ